MHYWVKKWPQNVLVRFDQLEQNGVEIKFLNTLTSSGECLGMVGVVRSAFRVPCLWGLPYSRAYCVPKCQKGVWGDASPL